MKRKAALPILAIAMAAVVLAQPATATHVRPRGASPLYVPLVIAYKACTAANSTHNLPLNFPSCTPPVQDSNFLTVGTPDANGAVANFTGFIRFAVRTTSTPEDVLIVSLEMDVRCEPVTSSTVCNAANTAGGADYSGQLQAAALIRITDHNNGASHTDPGTVVDVPLSVPLNCLNTAPNLDYGGTCQINTTENAILPGFVQDGKRANVEVQTVNFNDGGKDGVAGAADATRFATQGLWIP
jgi:hypothetical protein